jgi:hypothetical protein
MIQVVEIASLLFCKIKLSLQFSGIDSSMPHFWNQLKWHDIMSLVRNLDQKSQGVVDWRILLSYIALERSVVPKEIDVSGLKTENGFVEREEFVAHKWWFAKSETSKDREYSNTFERVKMLSGLLFDVNKTTVEGGREVLNVG